MIALSGIDYLYPSGGKALSSVTMNMDHGALIGLVGANGSGKSTLMSLMAGLFSPGKGTLSMGDLVSPGDEKKIRSICRMVMQDADLQILGSTVEEDLLLGRKRTDEAVKKAKEIAARFSLLDVWDKSVQSLSWGMKRKVCLAAALLDNPQVVLLDEPFSGLDYPGMREMRRMILENKSKGLTQVVSSHDLECFVDIVDELAVLDHGRLVLNGPAEVVLDHVAAYGVRPPCSWNAGLGIMPWEEAK
ncbi:energy-coupling factor ABC transporter ATP-binding protein [Pseudodesulfovibrio piezophilus]|uniref:ABC transporter related protein n=1 Tax=Pseudodesulfovibrio piezophilus (strain DSM 21447 / JCM 15486 / C1TLV30) TaxID=1322246 RepID=M1WV25_PSEP2|nr:ABC transporter ATP-binding protein [Pseudodesulfovibrio piezophilus]CCH48118.1 ABC transporter related protein [Pseudodesulfovibrio piezophilus C1TLV30]